MTKCFGGCVHLQGGWEGEASRATNGSYNPLQERGKAAQITPLQPWDVWCSNPDAHNVRHLRKARCYTGYLCKKPWGGIQTSCAAWI